MVGGRKYTEPRRDFEKLTRDEQFRGKLKESLETEFIRKAVAENEGIEVM